MLLFVHVEDMDFRWDKFVARTPRDGIPREILLAEVELDSAFGLVQFNFR